MVIAGGVEAVETQNIASAQGGGAAYRASMAALAALTQAAAQEFKAYNIEVLRIEDFRLLIYDW
jgi:NAD(P)-dependent dehydrogenase (short-subunit alcohol dehydrogenase family)